MLGLLDVLFCVWSVKAFSPILTSLFLCFQLFGGCPFLADQEPDILYKLFLKGTSGWTALTTGLCPIALSRTPWRSHQAILLTSGTLRDDYLHLTLSLHKCPLNNRKFLDISFDDRTVNLQGDIFYVSLCSFR